MTKRMSRSMRDTLLAIDAYSGRAHSGMSSYEVETAGGSRYCLSQAVKKGWVSTYGSAESQGFYSTLDDARTPKYYRTTQGTEVLKPVLSELLESMEPGDEGFEDVVRFFMDDIEAHPEMRDAVTAVYAKLVEIQLLGIAERIQKRLRTTPLTLDHFDLDQISEEVYELLGTYDSRSIRNGEFWEIVTRHTKRRSIHDAG